MIRTFDPSAFYRMAESPDVRDYLGFPPGTPTEVMNRHLHNLVTSPANHALVTDNGQGGYILVMVQPGLYVAHTLSLRPARGLPMQILMVEGFRYMFTSTDCIEVVTLAAERNTAARTWAERAHFRPMERRQIGSDWFIHYSLGLRDWVAEQPTLQALGEDFHERIDQVSTHTPHQHDPLHDRWVGYALMCAQSGQLGKGVGFYNRIAPILGFHPISVLSTAPPTVHVGDAIVSMIGGDYAITASPPTGGLQRASGE